MSDSIVEPELQEALDRAKEVADKIIESSKGAAEPLKEMQTLSSEISDIYKDVNWFQVNTNLFNPKKCQPLYEELFSLQKANFDTLLKKQEALFKEFTKSGQVLMQSNKDVSKPQSTVAKIINQSLDNFDLFSSKLKEQNKELTKMQSTYFKWCKKTLSSLSQPQS
ncbi:hypothetical protein [Halioxenophilus sp. WMMB6]|uniref:hypothetical protein n=1 Tax=Halioxenophilus sp. WMMB6 TaxID=3073815 RepID=UPI00295F3310|nr:hypothetical protein [Halioxenophilus sp. WMMB6]